MHRGIRPSTFLLPLREIALDGDIGRINAQPLSSSPELARDIRFLGEADLFFLNGDMV
jgi:hypothetical protein